MPPVIKSAIYAGVSTAFGGIVAYLQAHFASVPQADQVYVSVLITLAPTVTGVIGHWLTPPNAPTVPTSGR